MKENKPRKKPTVFLLGAVLFAIMGVVCLVLCAAQQTWMPTAVIYKLLIGCMFGFAICAAAEMEFRHEKNKEEMR